TIDFEAGTLKRAPAWIQKLCLEWLFRFFQEPRRLFSRYFIQGPRFFYYFFCQLLKQ
ncbi:MAG: WecB/TagA/CpsF family glycosyltransferase, partial [Muribaculaceae bacterium]|nr:WecB/TagA/CpsF family glycosyltransferase [Muribaculaceae bacterium]